MFDQQTSDQCLLQPGSIFVRIPSSSCLVWNEVDHPLECHSRQVDVASSPPSKPMRQQRAYRVQPWNARACAFVRLSKVDVHINYNRQACESSNCRRFLWTLKAIYTYNTEPSPRHSRIMFQEMPDAVCRNFSVDARTSAQAFKGIGALQWYSRHDQQQRTVFECHIFGEISSSRPFLIGTLCGFGQCEWNNGIERSISLRVLLKLK